ncbi:MAG: HNH endonuclease signature motif containing protein [Finegoldia sp.]|nr:HNH endonuclease signature motif containing protein [Finegoldia sp.]
MLGELEIERGYMAKKKLRADAIGAHRTQYDKNKKIILRTQNTCGICGRPVDMSLSPPDPLAPCIDHIIPISKGGHPSDINNLQLAHWCCNRQKSDKLYKSSEVFESSNSKQKEIVLGNRNLKQSMNWLKYKSD